MYQLDNTDRRILMILQRGIPIESRPYQVMAEELGEISEDEVITRIARLKENNIIRRMSGFFNSRKLGYVSMLCAIKADPAHIEEVAAVVNAYPGVTHNYIRQHTYTIWFTLIAINEPTLRHILDQIDAHPQVEQLLRFSTNTRFKINVTFDLGVK